jgi:hypothetical protein
MFTKLEKSDSADFPTKIQWYNAREIILAFQIHIFLTNKTTLSIKYNLYI